MNVKCPECETEISLADVNVAADIALCRKCGKNYSYAEASAAPEERLDVSHPPRGAWFRRDGRDFEIGAFIRSPIAFFLVPFMCLWSGGSIVMIYGKQIRHGRFDLWESLFGIPFLFGTLIIGAICLMTVFGKFVVSVKNNEGVLFTGVGRFGLRERFRWDRVRGVQQTHNGSSNGRPMRQLTLKMDKPVSFAWGLNAKRQQFMLASLRQMLREPR